MNCNFNEMLAKKSEKLAELEKLVEEDTKKYKDISDSFKDEKKRKMWIHFIMNRNIIKLVSKELDYIEDNYKLKNNVGTLKYMREIIAINNQLFDKIVEDRDFELVDDVKAADMTNDLTICFCKIYEELKIIKKS